MKRSKQLDKLMALAGVEPRRYVHRKIFEQAGDESHTDLPTMAELREAVDKHHKNLQKINEWISQISTDIVSDDSKKQLQNFTSYVEELVTAVKPFFDNTNRKKLEDAANKFATVARNIANVNNIAPENMNMITALRSNAVALSAIVKSMNFDMMEHFLTQNEASGEVVQAANRLVEISRIKVI